MRKGWATKKLSNLCEIKHGFAFDGKDFETDFKGKKPIVLTPGNFTEDGKLYFTEKNTKRCKGTYPEEFRFNNDDLVVVMTDLSSQMKILGRPAFIENENILHNQRIGRFFFLDNSLDKRYLYYFLQTEAYLNKIRDTATGTMVRHTAPKRILDNEIIIPPLPEQQRIVSVLDEAFASIAQAKSNAEQNLVNAWELFQSYSQDVFTKRGVGWKEMSLGDVCEFENGDRGKNYPNREEYVESGIPWINTGHILPNGTLSLSEMNYITEDKFASLRSGKIQSGDLVYCLRGATLGKTAIVDPFTKGAVASSLVIIRPGNLLDNHFLYYFLTSPYGQGLIKLYSNGAAQPNLGAQSVAKYTIFLPPLAEQRAIVGRLEALSAETGRLEEIYQQKVESLDELKKSVLEKAFVGEL